MIPHPWLSHLLLSLLLLPAGVLVGWGLYVRRRAAGVPVAIAVRFTVAEVAMVVGTAPWVWMILTPLPAPRELHPIPLLDIWGVLQVGFRFAVVQIVGNLLVFAAFSVFAPMRWRIGPVRVTLIAGAASFVLETLQYALELGRVSATDDVLLNALGAGLIALLLRHQVERLWSAQSEPTSVP